MTVDLPEEDYAYIKLMLIASGSERGRDIAAKIASPKQGMVRKQKPVIDKGPVNPVVSKKPYKTKPDYPAVKKGE